MDLKKKKKKYLRILGFKVTESVLHWLIKDSIFSAGCVAVILSSQRKWFSRSCAFKVFKLIQMLSHSRVLFAVCIENKHICLREVTEVLQLLLSCSSWDTQRYVEIG